MATLKAHTADETVVPGQERAAQERQEAQAKGQSAHAPFAPSTNMEQDYGPDYGKRGIRLHKSSEVNIYADQQEARTALDPRAKKVIALFGISALVFVFAVVLPTNIFGVDRIDRSLGTLAGEAATSFKGLISLFTGAENLYTEYALEIFAVFLAGAAMGVSGGVYQGSLKNALASPSTLGVTSGGSLGAIIYVLFIAPNQLSMPAVFTMDEYLQALGNLDPLRYVLQMYGEVIATLLGCFGIVALIMLISIVAGRGKVSNVAMVIAGTVFTAVIGVVITWVRYFFQTYGDSTTASLIASFQSVSFSGPYDGVFMASFALPLLVCFGIVFANTGRLSLLAFNDDEARSMGISTVRTRNLMVAVCTVMTALVLAFCGPVGFVGFMCPHIARKLVGPDFRYLLPACGILGAIVVALAHCIRILGIPWIVTGSTGMLTSIVGSFVFVVVALRQREVSHGDWL